MLWSTVDLRDRLFSFRRFKMLTVSPFVSNKECLNKWEQRMRSTMAGMSSSLKVNLYKKRGNSLQHQKASVDLFNLNLLAEFLSNIKTLWKLRLYSIGKSIKLPKQPKSVLWEWHLVSWRKKKRIITTSDIWREEPDSKTNSKGISSYSEWHEMMRLYRKLL